MLVHHLETWFSILGSQLVTGGPSLRDDILLLRGHCPDVLIATPGRLEQLLSQRVGKLGHLFDDVQLAVLDEVFAARRVPNVILS